MTPQRIADIEARRKEGLPRLPEEFDWLLAEVRRLGRELEQEKTSAQVAFENSKHAAIENEKLLVINLRLKEVVDFYATFSPRQHPEGYYEINNKPGEGGEVPFGTKAREALK